MSRRLALGAVLVALAALLVLPFTAVGTRLLLHLAGEFTPLETAYREGSLLGTLRLDSLALVVGEVDIEAVDAALALDPRCLWRSELCIERLQAAELAVRFPGGDWHSAGLDAALEYADGRLLVHRLDTADSRLTLDAGDDESPDAPVVLPEVALPFSLAVEALAMDSLLLELGGLQQRLQSTRLRGHWAGTVLAIDTLSVRREGVGDLSLEGTLEMAADWPVQASLDWLPQPLPELGRLAPASGRLLAGGSLAALRLELGVEGEASWEGRGEVYLLQPGMPFDAILTGQWPGSLPLGALPGVPAGAPDLQLQAPLTLSIDGEGGVQRLNVALGASGLGYRNARLEAVARWDGTALQVDRALLIHGEDRLQAAGSLLSTTPPRANWSLETAGFDLPAVSPRVAGRVVGHVQGDARLDADWSVNLESVELEGEVGGLPMRIAGRAKLRRGPLLDGGDLRGEMFGASLILQDRQLDASIPDLSRWHQAARGRLDLRVGLSPAGDRLSVEGTASMLRWHGLAIDGAAGSATLDPRSPLPEQLDLKLAGLAWQDFRIVTLKAEGGGDRRRQTLRLESSGNVAGVLALTAAQQQDGGWRGELAPAELATPLGYWSMPDPVGLTWSGTPGVLQVAAHCWYAADTSLCLEPALLGATGQVALKLDGALDFAAALLPGKVALDATARASLRADWSPTTTSRADVSFELPAGAVLRVLEEGERLRVDWRRIAGRATFGERGFEGMAEIETLGGRATAEWRLPAERSAGATGLLIIDGLQLDGLAALAPELEQLAGRLEGSVRFTGSVDQPQLRGLVALRDGALRVAGNPTQLEGLTLQLKFADNGMRLEGSGLLGGGPVRIEGRLIGGALTGAATDGPPQLKLAVTGEQQQLLVPPSLEMEVSPRLDVVATPGLVSVTGDVMVRSGVLELEQLPEGSVALSNDVVLVDVRGKEVAQAPPFDTGLDIAVKIRERFEVRGDLLTATLGGDLQLQQVPGKPLQLFGNLRTVGGELRLFGQVLRLDRGTIAFTGRPDRPDLDLRAERDIRREDVRVGVAVRGPLQEPQLEVYSSPAMSQTEAMSYLTRGRGLDSGATADSSALAMSMGFSAINRSGLLTGLNRLPGVNSIELGTDTTEEGTTATVGGYLGERLYLSYGTGVYEPITVLTGRLYLQSRLWLEVVSALENSLDVYYSFDID